MNRRLARLALSFGLAALLLGLPLLALGDFTTLTISNAEVTVTSSSPTTMNFNISRTSDTSYDAFLQYQTQDGTAVAGLNYTAASGSLIIPAGQTSGTIPVTIDGSTTNPADKIFNMLLLGGGGGSFTPSFAAQQLFDTGDTPAAIAVADMNGDGKPDLIVLNDLDDDVGVLLNTTAPGASTPSFASQQTFGVGETGISPGSIAVADVNGDGKPDLIVANFYAQTVSVLLNDTTPGSSTLSFVPQQTFDVGREPASVTMADVNGDGKPDLITADFESGYVAVRLNTTTTGAITASFATAQTFASGSDPLSVTTADVNGDGKLDLIVASYVNDNLWVLLNNTTPGASTVNFASAQTFPIGGLPYTVVAADINGDGQPDLIIANESNNTVSVLLNTTEPGAATASFSTSQNFATGSAPQSVAVADLNDDGKPDLVVQNLNDNNLSVLFNLTAPGAGTPSFATQQVFDVGNLPVQVVAADVNGDGKRDLIASNSNDNTVSVLLNTIALPSTAVDANSFDTHQDFATGNVPQSVVAADVNGDGKPDLIAANSADNTVSVLLDSTTPGATTPSFVTQQTFGTGSTPSAVKAADVNGDGTPDLVTANESADTVSVLLNTTTPGSSTVSFNAHQDFPTGTGPEAVTIADVNLDGLPDLITANGTADTVSVLLNATTFVAGALSFDPHQDFDTGTDPISVTTADINGDGLPDVIVANSLDNTVSVLLNTTVPGSGTASFSTQETFATGNSPQSVAARDVNGDGKPDLIVVNSTDDTVSVLLNTTSPGSSTASFDTQQTFETRSNPASVTVLDVNGDGKPDLIVANSVDDTISVLINQTTPGSSTASFATQQTFSTGLNPVSVAAVDVNGDGALDLISANSSDDTVSVLLNALYQVVAAGSPATGTIDYDVPTPIPTKSPTATPSSTPAPSPTPSPPMPLPTPTQFPTPVPGALAGIVTALAPVRVASTGGETVNGGSFTYSNSSANRVQIGSVVVTASAPAALTSITLSETGTPLSVTISRVGATNVFLLRSPIVVAAGQSASFNVTAVTGSSASSAALVYYAGMITGGGGGLLGGGLLMMGLLTLPMADRRRRSKKSLTIKLLAMLLIAATVGAAGCGGNSGTEALTQRQAVDATGHLRNPVTLSRIALSASPTVTTTLQLISLGFR